jgi:hypothetical protein
MTKEKNCQCAICKVEQSLLSSLRTQIAQTHFQTLAHNYSVLSHFQSPADVIARLHEHERVEAVNHNAWSGILHALVDSIADATLEEIGQQLLLVAYAPAIHKVYREVCQKFPGLGSEDIAQQAALCFLETARSPEMQCQNGHLPAALARRFRQGLFRWAIGEARQLLPLKEMDADLPEPQAGSFEEGVLLEHLLAKSQRMGILSASESQLIRKFHCEGFQREELRHVEHGSSAIALYCRIQRAVRRLRRVGATDSTTSNPVSSLPNSRQLKKTTKEALDFSGDVCIRKSRKGISPEPSRNVLGFDGDMAGVAA